MRFAIVVVAAAALASSALAWSGEPRTKPPSPAQPGGPPPAWAETATRSAWLAYGSYCWRTTCADYLPPTGRDDLPRLVVRRGDRLRLHVAFAPSELVVRRLPAGTSVRLPATRVTTWRPTAAGIAVVEARGPGGSASYVVGIAWG